jgi:uncharacterized integral membrane protein
MSVKTIFIIIISVLVTVILMNNTDDVNFWIFGNTRVPKLAILGAMFVLGLIIGYLVGRPKQSRKPNHPDLVAEDDNLPEDYLSDEDREYIR